MLTARQGPVLPRLAVSFRHAVAAESSRQAQVRHRAYSSAALAPQTPEEDLSDPKASERAQQVTPSSTPSASTTPHSLAPIDPSTSDSASPYLLNDPLTEAERFRRTVRKDPIRAFFSLRTLSPERLQGVRPKDVRNIMWHLGRMRKATADVSAEEATECLSLVRSVLHAQSSMPGKEDAGLGKPVQGKTLRLLIRAAAALGADNFAAELFFERVDEQVRTPEQIIDLDGIASDLAWGQRWILASRLFDPERIPAKLMTPHMILVGMRAALGVRRPWDAVTLYRHLDPHEVGPEAHCAYVSALLELGDAPAAKDELTAAIAAGVDREAIQLAMLSGHSGVEVEDAVRSSMERLRLEPTAGVLNAFLRRRLAASDLPGAERILTEFAGIGNGKVPPNPATAALMLALAGRKGDRTTLRSCWRYIASKPALVHEKSVSLLIRSLGRIGAASDAVDLFEASVRREPAPGQWPLPLTFRPGVWVANSAMKVAIAAEGYEGFSRVASLMREGNIEPDERTVLLVLHFAGANLVTSPERLAVLFRALLAKTSAAPPTAQHLNVLLTEGARLAMRDPKQASRYLRDALDVAASPDILAADTPTPGALRQVLEGRARLDASGKRSSLGTRLLYDAFAIDRAWPADAIRQTWQSYLLDGHAPSESDYVSLIQAYCQTGDLSSASDVLTYAEEEGHGRTPAMLTALIVGCSRVGNWKQARRYYDQIASPDVAAFTAMLRTYMNAKEWARAFRLARRECENGRLGELALDSQAIYAVARTISASDWAGSTFWIAHHAITEKGGDIDDFSAGRQKFPLTPALRKLVRTNRKGLERLIDRVGKGHKRPAPHDKNHELVWPSSPPGQTDHERNLAAVRLATRMLQDDDIMRPQRIRRRPTLTKRYIDAFADQLDVNLEDEAVQA